MRSVSVEAEVRRRSAEDVYDEIRDFERYPSVCEAVLSVSVRGGRSPEEVESTWEVDFGDGVLEWTEQDRLNPEQFSIWFEQLTGDFQSFSGHWKITPDGDGCVVQFTAQFDMGIPSLSAMLEPMAERALRENVAMILTGLLGAEARVR